MPRVLRFRRWLLRPVLLVLALAQVVVVLAPSIDRADDRDAGVHLETEGTRLHYVHDDTACPACQAQHLNGRVVTPMRLVVIDVLEPGVRLATPSSFASARTHHPASPRAPPVDRLV